MGKARTALLLVAVLAVIAIQLFASSILGPVGDLIAEVLGWSISRPPET
jgi:hypothetical protein